MMESIKKALSFCAVTVTVFVLSAGLSCSRQDPVAPHGNAAIKIEVTGLDTKSQVTTTSALEASGAFTMDAFIDDVYEDEDENVYPAGQYIDGSTVGGNVRLSGRTWSLVPKSDGTPWTWVGSIPTYFWAWYPVNVSGRAIYGPEDISTSPDKIKYSGKLLFSYTTPTPNQINDADRAYDLLFAYSKQTFIKKNNNDAVTITFHHALSQVRFCVSTDDGTFDATSLSIKNISISGLKTKGKASFSDSGNAAMNNSHVSFDWTDLEGNGTYGQNYGASFKTSSVAKWDKGSYTSPVDHKTYNLYTCNNVFFFIPQKVTDTNQMTVTFEVDGKYITKTVPIADNDGVQWIGDYYYTYKINATRVGRDIDLSVSLAGWSDRDDKIFI